MMDRNDGGQASWSLGVIFGACLILTLFAGIERQDYKSFQVSAIKIFQPLEESQNLSYDYPIIVCYSLEVALMVHGDSSQACASQAHQVETYFSMPWWYGEPVSSLPWKSLHGFSLGQLTIITINKPKIRSRPLQF